MNEFIVLSRGISFVATWTRGQGSPEHGVDAVQVHQELKLALAGTRGGEKRARDGFRVALRSFVVGAVLFRHGFHLEGQSVSFQV